MILGLAIAAASLAGLSACIYFANLKHYRPLREACGGRAKVSVLVPARDEADSIGGLIESVLAGEGVDLELVVLDDHSGDGTDAVVRSHAERDGRVRLVSGEPLPAGWCGKQFACWQLAHAARHDVWLFLDADVRLRPDAVARAAAEREAGGYNLLSGVPRQTFQCVADRMLIPLIHFVLLAYLPLGRAERFALPKYAAGCGQFFLTTRSAYAKSGGHEAVRGSMHDGLMLPTAYRRAGLRTTLRDLTDAATCRMYEADGEVLSGLGKNAAEGIAHPARIGPFTLLLGVGHVLPWGLLAIAEEGAFAAASAACGMSLLPRLDAAARFRQPLWAAVLHPVSVVGFLWLQWAALLRHVRGVRPTWKGRGVAVGAGPVAPETVAAVRVRDEKTLK